LGPGAIPQDDHAEGTIRDRRLCDLSRSSSKGIGTLAGLEDLEVPGATGYFDTNYEGKAQFALKGLKEKDFVYVHVELLTKRPYG